MANQNQNQQGGKGKQPQAPKCPQCGQNPLPKDKVACLVCQPDYRIDGDLHKTQDGWRVIVQTYQNNDQVILPFVFRVTGCEPEVVGDQSPYWKGDGLAIVPLGFCEKKREVNLHVVGGPDDVRDLEVPASLPPKFVKTEADETKSFLQNLLKAVKGA